MQELWIESNQITISHSTFNKILSEQEENHRQRVITFVSKAFQFSVTSRSDLCSDTYIQILNISGTNIENFSILNVYNEKSQKSNSYKYTVERKLTTIELTQNSLVCGDFNAHHQWWNSRITSSIRANSLIEWLNKYKCELINTSDEFTFIRETSNSIIDLTFAIINLASQITKWIINDEAETDSDHEVIEFSIHIEKIETVNNTMNGKFNAQKANWEKSDSYLKNNHSIIKDQMIQLMINLTLENLNEGAKLLRDVIIDASNHSISKRRSGENSKVWWTDELTQLRKNLAKAKRMHKTLRTNENLSHFKQSRNVYFQAIRHAKQESWSNFLNNAVGKEIFQAYKFLKNNRMKKLSSIHHDEKTNVEFEDKCDAFIEAMYSASSDIENESNENDVRLALNSNSFEWSNLIEIKLQKAIFTSASNKASGSDQLCFLIVQKAYNSISDIFFMLYSELINRDHHSECWKEWIEAILKKSN